MAMKLTFRAKLAELLRDRSPFSIFVIIFCISLPLDFVWKYSWIQEHGFWHGSGVIIVRNVFQSFLVAAVLSLFIGRERK
jgi:hypothetical protein